jgi:hypothetical protein
LRQQALAVVHGQADRKSRRRASAVDHRRCSNRRWQRAATNPVRYYLGVSDAADRRAGVRAAHQIAAEPRPDGS